jgi:hypothetical protein
MSNALVSWLILLLIAGVLSYALHKFVRRFALACVAAAVLAATAFQVIAFLQLGYLDKFWPIAATITFFVSIVIGVIVGWFVRRLERNGKLEGH